MDGITEKAETRVVCLHPVKATYENCNQCDLL
jgi:hypothetical protein